MCSNWVDFCNGFGPKMWMLIFFLCVVYLIKKEFVVVMIVFEMQPSTFFIKKIRSPLSFI